MVEQKVVQWVVMKAILLEKLLVDLMAVQKVV